MGLVFNDTATELGICQEIDSICDTDENSYTLAAKARRSNAALEELELMALMADGRWQFDDSNYAALPTGLMTAVDGQSEYDYDSTLLFLERIEILDSGGVWQKLAPMDEIAEDKTQTDLAVEGTPTEYYKRGNKFGFNFVPKSTNMTLTNGIKVFFKRTASLFVATDTTKAPGIPSPFHIIIPQKASLPHCRAYKKDRVAGLLADIAAGEKRFVAYYASRSKDESGQMTMRRTSGR